MLELKPRPGLAAADSIGAALPSERMSTPPPDPQPPLPRAIPALADLTQEIAGQAGAPRAFVSLCHSVR
jgi:hypothetical protein